MELYVIPEEGNTQHLFGLSSIGQMLLRVCRNTIWCEFSGRGGGGGGGGGGIWSASSKNPVARRRQQPTLLWHITQSFGDVPVLNTAKICVLCCFNRALCLRVLETVRGTEIIERAFRLATEFLSGKQCFTNDSQIFEHHGFASRRVCELSSRVTQPLNAH